MTHKLTTKGKEYLLVDINKGYSKEDFDIDKAMYTNLYDLKQPKNHSFLYSNQRT